jgi:chromosome segregation ATPase
MQEAGRNRRVDDARISDIQDSVHEIRSDVRGLERRLERSDDRISDVERGMIETAAAQKALESVMNAENRRLSEKIDGVQCSVNEVHKTFVHHSNMEESDRRTMMRAVIATFTSLLGAIGWWLFSQHTGG